jgi:hypothetical protein
MSRPAHTVRLHILLSDGLSGLSRVIDRLAVLAVATDLILFRVDRRDRGYVHVQLGSGQQSLTRQLALRLRPLVQVSRIRITSADDSRLAMRRRPRSLSPDHS